jgi:dihydrofolate synthase/folylpolyglutamate synthase
VKAIAFIAFRNAGIEQAILETGLGGRLDSTTTAKANVVAITPIAMDHQEYLGNTLASIAAEKAAIIRPGVTAVLATQPPEALEVLVRRCEETGVVPLFEDSAHLIEETSPDGRFCVTFESPRHRYEKVWLGLRGEHQIDNAAVAIRLAELLHLPASAIVTGISSATHHGRLELIQHRPAVLLDGAHNPAGCHALRDYLDEFAPRPLTLVFGAMRDKQLEEMGEILFPIADLLVLTVIENPRCASVETLGSVADRFAKGKVMKAQSSAQALRIATERTSTDGLICIAGSLYLIGELRPLILNALERQT